MFAIRNLATLLVVLPGCLLMWVSQSAGSYPVQEPARDDSPSLVVMLVRHAEKTAAAGDPDLSDAGRRRADRLAGLLRDAEIQFIHSSNYRRTRLTGQPLADSRNLEIELYDPEDLAGLVGRLRARGGRHLVIGHSNTTPAVVRLLGGQPGPDIDEASEYDRLYVVTITDDGNVSSLLLRYGQPFHQLPPRRGQ